MAQNTLTVLRLRKRCRSARKSNSWAVRVVQSRAGLFFAETAVSLDSDAGSGTIARHQRLLSCSVCICCCVVSLVYEPDPAQVTRAQNDARLSAALSGLQWFDSKEQFLKDASIVGVACEGDNAESLGMTRQIIAAGKHCWLDKPAGDNWVGWEEIVADAVRQGLQIQLGYMLRYNPAFEMISTWARSGLLGDIFSKHHQQWCT